MRSLGLVQPAAVAVGDLAAVAGCGAHILESARRGRRGDTRAERYLATGCAEATATEASQAAMGVGVGKGAVQLVADLVWAWGPGLSCWCWSWP